MGKKLIVPISSNDESILLAAGPGWLLLRVSLAVTIRRPGHSPVWRCAFRGTRLRLFPPSPLSARNLRFLDLPFVASSLPAGSRRRASLSGRLPVPPARTGCLSSFREPRVATCSPGSGRRLAATTRSQLRPGVRGPAPVPGGEGVRRERQRLSPGGYPRSGTAREGRCQPRQAAALMAAAFTSSPTEPEKVSKFFSKRDCRSAAVRS